MTALPEGVRCRVWGEDKPFLKAFRFHPRFQNNTKDETGISLTDCDIIVCNYKQCGLKDLRSVQIVELKSRNAEPTWSQKKAYQVLNAFQGKRDGWLFYGASFISHSGPDFDTAESYRWGRFRGDNIFWRTVDRETIFDLAAMVKQPDTLKDRKLFKSHHGKYWITMEVTHALGFKTNQTVLKRY